MVVYSWFITRHIWELYSFWFGIKQLFADGLGLPFFFFSPDVNFYFFNSTCLLLPIHLPHASMLWSCDTMDCSPPGSFVRGLFQARILEWVAISFSLGLPFLTGDPLPLKRITVSEILVVRTQRGNICLPRWEPVIFCSSLHTWDPTSRVLWREKGLYL